MRNKITTTLLCGFLALNLTACSIPFFGEKDDDGSNTAKDESKISERTPDQIFYLMFDKMQSDLKTADYELDATLEAIIDQSKLSYDSKTKISDKVLSLGVDRTYVLGIDNASELAAAFDAPSVPQVEIAVDDSETDLSYKSSLGEELVAVDDFAEVESMELEPEDYYDDIYEQPSLFGFGENKLKVKVNYLADGKFDVSDEDVVKGESNLQMEVDMSGMIVRFNFETKMIGDDIYFKIDQLPPPFSMMMDIDFLEKWWNLNLDELAAEHKDVDSLFAREIPEGLEFLYDEERSKEIEAELEALVKKYKIFEVAEVFDEESLEGSLCYHYKIELNKNIIRNAFIEVYDYFIEKMEETLDDAEVSMSGDEIALASIRDARNEIDVETKAKIKEFVSQFANLISDTDIDVWIDKESYFLKKSTFDIELSLRDLDIDEISEDMKEAIDINISGDLKYSNHNEEVNIEAPIEYESFLSFITGMLDDSQMKSRDARRLSDVKQIQTALELYYNDFESYPLGLEDLSEGDLVYFSVLPSYPEAAAASVCADNYEYSYKVLENGENYELYYCLEAKTGGVPAGNNIASAYGFYDPAKTPEILPSIDNTNPNTDSDLDGLFDKDEVEIYKTDPNNSDTDGDGYLDGDEVKNGYNPAGSGTLSDLLLADWSVYNGYDFSIKYPTDWSIDNQLSQISEEERALSGIKIQILSPYTSDEDTFAENILVSILDSEKAAYKSLDEWAESFIDGKKVVSSEKKTMFSVPCMETIYESSVVNNGVDVALYNKARYFIKNSKFYLIQYSALNNSERNALEYEADSVKIMNSFDPSVLLIN